MAKVYILSIHYIDPEKNDSFHRVISVCDSRDSAKEVIGLIQWDTNQQYNPNYMTFKITERLMNTYKHKYQIVDDDYTEYREDLCHMCNCKMEKVFYFS